MPLLSRMRDSQFRTVPGMSNGCCRIAMSVTCPLSRHRETLHRVPKRWHLWESERGCSYLNLPCRLARLCTYYTRQIGKQRNVKWGQADARATGCHQFWRRTTRPQGPRSAFRSSAMAKFALTHGHGQPEDCESASYREYRPDSKQDDRPASLLHGRGRGPCLT